MPQARKRLVSTAITPFYHVISRCVWRHYLCGIDPLTGKDYSARKQEIQNRLALLTQVDNSLLHMAPVPGLACPLFEADQLSFGNFQENRSISTDSANFSSWLVACGPDQPLEMRLSQLFTDAVKSWRS